MAFREWVSGLFRREDVAEAAPQTAPAEPPAVSRAGFEYGIGRGGLTETNQGAGTGQVDRRSLLQQLYEAHLACPWSWASVQAIARTVTAGGLMVDWIGDDEGEQEVPEKPLAVLALESLLKFVNPREDIRQLLRSTIADLLVFGDAFIEVVWLGNVPVALYTLDAPSMLPLADQHGEISGYVQLTDQGQRAEFEPRDVIHISLDAPRSGVFGVSPTQAAMTPITAWLFAAAVVKETYRKGDPVRVHADLPRDMSPAEVNKWTAQHMSRHVGPRNIGMPMVTKGGAKITEMHQSKVADALATLDQKRDEILACYGIPPAEVGVIESGNIGGGTGESQRKTYEVNVCQPIAELVLEKLVYALVQRGFGIFDWTLKFRAVDVRDSKTVEEIREKRVRTGQWTLNRARAEIGEPPVEGGDLPFFVDGTTKFLYRDVVPFMHATLAALLRGTGLEPGEPASEDVPVVLVKHEHEPVPAELAKAAGLDPGTDPGSGKQRDQDDDEESQVAGEALLAEWRSRYRERLHEALEKLPVAA